MTSFYIIFHSKTFMWQKVSKFRGKTIISQDNSIVYIRFKLTFKAGLSNAISHLEEENDEKYKLIRNYNLCI